MVITQASLRSYVVSVSASDTNVLSYNTEGIHYRGIVNSSQEVLNKRNVQVNCCLCPSVAFTEVAESYVDRTSHQAGLAAELAATRKEDKYVNLGARYIFEPIATETLGVFNASARQLLADLGRRISTCLLYTSPSPRDRQKTRMPSSA